MYKNYKLNRYMFMLSAVLVIALLIVVAYSASADASNEQFNYNTNEHGQTFGSAMFAESYETEPDLISAMGENGVFGYVYKEDLYCPTPSTREEALAMSQTRIKTQTIPLYASDGRTVIGEFIIGGAVVIEMRDVVGEKISTNNREEFFTPELYDDSYIVYVQDSNNNLFREITTPYGAVYHELLTEEEFIAIREGTAPR
jgi:hypothetical protein